MSTLLYNTRPTMRPARAFNSLLNELLRDAQPATPQPSTTFVPAADIFETAQGFELHLALPGVAKAAVSLDFQDNQLVVSGNRPAPATEGDNVPQLRRVETRFGEFRRAFRLPEAVSAKHISAEMADGLLRVMLPFDTEKVTKQHIEVR
ncbi:Hsp20/alpha crystallin family protein [Hymenobacter sp. H14-R3]|uniref:Hsp20/alpha crystallin family protein n=1 Tax=Hymenobacter sp. H14-R3 TaxID=3046308 RepID=UPI0024BB93C2|nr:Hsp20/alpha crystallin family protein [Hymenobacter sp. H14-R3]MDJ0364758.1 Hsp20/alpha crystallin family protein [Hymenobacter sp. H14-R3]